ncbi:hypothetical protein [Nocardia xishanensis]|uniref:hypothetical protein n=1 Tax=Nocardia xishanensis TaxID=238964 RepID=UPI0008329ACD|nr:hypothetical protein [Nocardia xishanensis]
MLETSRWASDPTSVPSIERPTAALRDLHAVLRELATGFPPGVLVGLTVRSGDEIGIRAWSSPRAKLAEEAQLISETAPNRLALRDESAVTVADLDAEIRWSECRAQLRLLGLRSLHCRKVAGANGRVAVLALYADRPNVFADLGGALNPACREIAAMLDGGQ